MGKFITLREEFESETGAHRFADQQYIQWLERVVERQRVVKNCSIPDVVRRRELLLAFCEFMYSGTYDSHNTTHSQDVDAFLESQ